MKQVVRFLSVLSTSILFAGIASRVSPLAENATSGSLPTTNQPNQALPVIHLTVNATATSDSKNNNMNQNSLTSVAGAGGAIPCSQYFGRERKQCMHCLPLEELHQALCAMNSRARKNYLEWLSLVERAGLRSEFSKTAEYEQLWRELAKVDPAFVQNVEYWAKTYSNYSFS